MTIDVIAGYYKQAHRLPTFTWGIEANRADINEVFIVSDGPFDEVLDCPYRLLHHPKYAHGNGASYNQGAHASRADYLFFTGMDLILPPGTIGVAKSKATPKTLVIGAVDGIDQRTTVADLPNPSITLVDMDDRNQRFNIYGNSTKSYYLARNGHTMVHRETFLALGGFDERFAIAGYGFEDYEFGIRWCKEFTGKGIVRSGARAWHFCDDRPVSERPRPSDAALKLFVLSEVAYHGGKLRLFDGSKRHDTACVGHLDNVNMPDISAVDCNNLTWIPPMSLTYLFTCPAGANNPQQHVIDCWSKVANGGVLELNDSFDDCLLDVLGDVRFEGNASIRKTL